MKARKTTLDEGAFLNYWLTKIRLLEIGIPYETIDKLSNEEVESLLTVQGIIDDRRNEEQMKGM